MDKKESWIDTVTPALKSAIAQTAMASYANACDLMKDAKLLFKENRLSRAGALFILSEEEFSKAFVLIVCMQQNRWDSAIFNGLMKHPEKQGIAAGMREYVDWFVKNYNSVMKMNQFSLVPTTPAVLPSKQRLDELIANTRTAIKRQGKDKYKQSLFYVGFDRNGKVVYDPKNANREQIENCFNEAEQFKEIVEIALSGQIPGFSKILI